jgi:O-antigen/teichoic acid export membrane protein
MVTLGRKWSSADSGRIVGRRAGIYTMTDQLLSSGSNFALGVLVGRAGGASALGAFGIAFLVWLAVLGANRALVCEPMTVGGSIEGSDRSEGARASLVLALAVAAVLAMISALILWAGFKPAVAVLALAPWLPSLLVQDYYRSVSFRIGRPDQALFSDAVFIVVQAILSAALLAYHVTDVSALLAAWGIGATAGAAGGLALSGIGLGLRGGLTQFRRLWPRSRWFLAEFSTQFAAVQGYLLLLPVLLGTAAFGQYRAGSGLIGPVIVIFTAGGNVGLPGCVQHLRQGGIAGLDRYTARLTLGVMAMTIPYCAAAAIFAPQLLQLVYGESFVGAAVITRLVALSYILATVSYGCAMALKAADQMRRLWLMRVVSASISVATTLFLASAWGLVGAGWATAVIAVTNVAGILILYQQLRGSMAAGARVSG